MLETSATNVVVEAIGRSLGESSEVTVRRDGFLVMPDKAAAARCIGTTGRVFRAVFDGWGTAFEKRRIAVQILVDLNWCVDELVLSVLQQAELTFRHQAHQRVRAAASGIMSPLDMDAFMDRRRLRIDIAAAIALRGQLESDAAVMSWIEDQLRLASGQMHTPGQRPLARVHGFVLAIPFALNPMELPTVADGRNGRSRWLDNEISISPYTVEQRKGAFAAAIRVLQDTPLDGRPIVTGSIWPCDAAERGIARAATGSGASVTIDPKDLPERREWRFLLERRLVGVDEVFD
ncbi:hypothetical protein [Sphingomonas sp. PvP018]|uniref:hypothetical protein n=1 Tax=Sphingomonas sp. PvP018 TaxID=2817852 RepID=UPI001AE41801|nr:hypothetical protein [Sphingomonas sp. PvP018]MBP2513771.1 hypothetical protein [Sphingomonas sp. PvP018]